jgi:hypothetical protein
MATLKARGEIHQAKNSAILVFGGLFYNEKLC